MIEKVINMQMPVYAHTPDKEGGQRETLEEHNDRCLKYWRILLDKKNLTEKFANIYKMLGIENTDFLMRSLEGVISFHDVGKINPVFQKEKMKNDLKTEGIEALNGSCHAFFSSVIYLDYFCFLLEKEGVSRKEKQRMKMILFMNAYIISRHHRDLVSLEKYISEFQEGGQAYILCRCLEKNEKKDLYWGPSFFTAQEEEDGDIRRAARFYENGRKGMGRKENIILNVYMRLLYSVLTTSDYYATAEYNQGLSMEKALSYEEQGQFLKWYENTDLIKRIRKYQKENYKKEVIKEAEKDINRLRSELFLDIEDVWEREKEHRMFFLEAPTGSGKSNCAVNLSLQMWKEGIKKLWYIYPFNTLVEQNLEVLQKIFGENHELFSQITVLNSVTPMKRSEEEENCCYEKSLLDRQFLNYPFILTTHVSFFRTLFSAKREDVFGFLQLSDSVIVLDEIQSYRNQIWTEIVVFLKVFAEVLNMKVVIMSATLPNLELLTKEGAEAVYLVEDREKYFCHRLFQRRVEISYELLNGELTQESLYQHICENTPEGAKVLIEFITKKSAERFYKKILEEEKFRKVYCLTGDDNIIDRKRILSQTAKNKADTVLLIATQVIEAGVDLDMDIGYKDISILDSEEQFMGRINRSCKKNSAKVYFFHLDKAELVYHNDVRTNHNFTLCDSGQQEILKTKNFGDYYLPVLEEIIKANEKSSEKSIEKFFEGDVGRGNFEEIEKRMQLIQEDGQKISVLFGRKISLETGEELDGWLCWKEYDRLLKDSDLPYARKQYELSVVKSKMNYFIYQVDKTADLFYSDKIGDLYAVQDGDMYFTNGKLDREKLSGREAVFL